MIKNNKNNIWKIVIAFVIDLIITSFCTVWMWNNIVAILFKVPEITILQGWLISLVVTYFIPHNKQKIEKVYDSLVSDISYTITVWLFAFVLSLFAF